MDVRHRLLTWCFIFKLIISLLLIIGIEASPKIEESNLDLNDRVLKLEAKDRHQDGEMALLKNALDEEKKLVHDLTNRVAILEGSNKISGRPKRPVRLLPPHILRGKEKNETDADDASQYRFYGPATGCNDLGRLGYTLNGLYLVHEKENKSTNSSSGSNIRQIEIVECRFRQKPKLGNQTDDKERRLGFICLNNDNTSCHSKESGNKERGLTLERGNDSINIQSPRSNVKGGFELKETDTNKKKVSKKPKEKGLNITRVNKVKKADTERGLQFDRTNGGGINKNNLQPSRSDGEDNFDLKKADDKENELEFTTPINKVKKSSTAQPPVDVKQYCLYKLRSEAHKYAMPKKLMNMCLVAANRKTKKNGIIMNEMNESEYYLGQSPCDSVNDEEHWTIRNKHICSNKNDMCLTVLPNIKDGGVLVNLMAYEKSAKSQKWIFEEQDTIIYGKGYGTITNVGTSMCLFEPMRNNGKRNKANTTVTNCKKGDPYLEEIFYFEKVNLVNRKNCSPF